MTDEELTAFLRDLPFLRAAKAADRIEELEAKLAKAVRGLNAICVWGEDTYARDMARTTLAEIEGIGKAFDDDAEELREKLKWSDIEGGEGMRYTTLPYDYARCISKDCPLEETCMRKTPGRETYQTIFHPTPSGNECDYYIHKEED
jgi:hypothetical protein